METTSTRKSHLPSPKALFLLHRICTILLISNIIVCLGRPRKYEAGSKKVTFQLLLNKFSGVCSLSLSMPFHFRKVCALRKSKMFLVKLLLNCSNFIAYEWVNAESFKSISSKYWQFYAPRPKCLRSLPNPLLVL